ncbi:MAG: heat-inducible transcriptional repressor HrcA [Paludibaculum sp.]
MLSPRTIEVLHSIVQMYIETGEPVASRSIARLRKDNLSAATIRNIMADLADLGYLDQPHTSAGRVPTPKAFKHFAQGIAASRVPGTNLDRLREELGQRNSLEERAEHSSHLLTELTRNVGIVAAIPAISQCLDHLELVPLSEFRVLMVVVTSDGFVRNQVAHLTEPVSADELSSIRNYVNVEFGGWSLQDIRRELGRRLLEERATYDSLLRKLTVLYSQGLLQVGVVPQIYLEGASNLVGIDLHLTKERLRDLFRALEEKKRLMELLDQFLADSSAGIQVQIGLGDAHPAMRDFSLIGISVEMPGGLQTKMAVLGPMRMNYPRVLSAVTQIGLVLKTLPQ